jgi:hypothetical protein
MLMQILLNWKRNRERRDNDDMRSTTKSSTTQSSNPSITDYTSRTDNDKIADNNDDTNRQINENNAFKSWAEVDEMTRANPTNIWYVSIPTHVHSCPSKSSNES